jgi:3D (Asp-Asp-Asp) domain-containing protein
MRHANSTAMVLAAMLIAGCSHERRMTVTATAFNSTKAQTDSRPTETACGGKLKADSQVIAVSRDLKKQGLVCGSEVEIDGLKGTWTVVDLTAARHEKLIDIYMGRDVKAARKWGRQEVDIIWRPTAEQRRKTRLAQR